MVSARIVLPAIITGLFLTYIANAIGGFAVFAPAPYNQYIVLVSALMLAVIPVLVANGVIPALTRFGGFSFVITGSVFTATANAIAGFAAFFPAPTSTYLLVLSLIINAVGQILVQNGIIPALALAFKKLL